MLNSFLDSLHARAPRALLGCSLLLGGCGSDSIEAVEEPQVTAIVVSPEDFRGSVPCVDAPGAMRAYTVTLQQVEAAPRELEGAEVPGPWDSGVIGCEQGAAFGGVQIGAKYAARIAAYDRSDLVPSPADALTLTDPLTGDAVPPRWTSLCGCTEEGLASNPPNCEGSNPVVAEYQALRHVRNCTPFMDDALTPTEVRVLLDATSTGLECGTEGDALASFVLLRDGAEVGRGDCGQTVTLPATPGESFELAVLAYTADAPEAPAFGGICRARAASGASVLATCDPLESRGGIELSLESALTALGAVCTDAVTNLVVSLDDEMQSSVRVARVTCGGSVRFSDLTPGTFEVTLAADRAGAPLAATCTATVEPGLVAAPVCASTP